MYAYQLTPFILDAISSNFIRVFIYSTLYPSTYFCLNNDIAIKSGAKEGKAVKHRNT